MSVKVFHDPETPPKQPWFVVQFLEAAGSLAFSTLDHLGSVMRLLAESVWWVLRSCLPGGARIGRQAIISQIVRVGVRSVGIVSLVSGCVGLILAFQLAPPLDDFGKRDLIANIIGVAITRELGPLIGAIVLTGFAGASIAAEIGTMVVSEEVEALEAHALNPVRFLVVPRVLASVLAMTVLGTLSTATALSAAAVISSIGLGVPWESFKTGLLDQVKFVDYMTGVAKSSVFGLLIGVIACANGLKVKGGAAGVGQATTSTVVQCVVAIVIADLIFTAIFYALKLF
jgi:phospholipid/cholesterol/gamma-HCH transport system permease protein